MSGLGVVIGRLSVRLRLLLLALLPLVVLLPLLLGITVLRWSARFDALLIAKVASDLRVAEQYFGRIQATQAAEIAALAESVRFADARAQGQVGALLAAEQAEAGLDFLIYGGGDLPLPLQQVARAVMDAGAGAGLAVLAARDLEELAPDLPGRARFELLPTEAARTIAQSVEDRGMVLLAVHPTDDGNGMLLGGRLLNRNLDFIDTMNALVYQEDGAGQARTGTTTLFLDDVRISTNVRLFEGERALGTRVSEAVWRRVMQGGETWLDRAFVVNDWYISGYVPLSDISGQRIGMLYTGFLAAPYAAARNFTIWSMVAAFLAVLALSAPIFLRVARGVFAPLERMTATMERAEAGALDARIGAVSARDEIGAVARHLDRLLDQVQERDAELRDYANNLNDLVAQRTAELEETNRKLEATFAQLVVSEKLAAVGEITAGVAHEINNPLAVILGNLEVLRNQLDHQTRTALATELDLIDAQAHRINLMVDKLLNFTRPGEISTSTDLVDPRRAVEDALVLVSADLRKNHIETRAEHHKAPRIRIVESELQQVLVNLMINAAQAMEGGGLLTVATREVQRAGVSGAEILVADTGPGIAPEKINNVFDPFFTTKLGEGSGLGLSISQALMARAGGRITVESEKGVGAKFFVWCPSADNLSET